MNVKLKVLRRNKEKGYSDRIYYYFFVNFEHLFGDWNYKLKYTISHKFANPFLYRNKIWTPVYMHVCTSFFPVPQVSNKTIYIF